jgi:hypothetical protein
MPSTIVAALGAKIGGSIIKGSSEKRAANIQAQGAQAGIDETRRQFDALKELMAPYVEAGTEAIAGLQPYAEAGAPALEQQQILAGLKGPEAQRAAIDALAANPEFQALSRQGEEALLQRASATGGLRGGNIQGALAQYRPQMLQGYIDQQYGRLGGLTALGQLTTQNIASMGQASAAGQAGAGMESAKNIAGLLGDQATYRAGGALAQGRMIGGIFGDIMGAAGKKYGF